MEYDSYFGFIRRNHVIEGQYISSYDSKGLLFFRDWTKRFTTPLKKQNRISRWLTINGN